MTVAVVVVVVVVVVGVVVVDGFVASAVGTPETITTSLMCQSVPRRSLFRERASTVDFGGKKVAFIW